MVGVVVTVADALGLAGAVVAGPPVGSLMVTTGRVGVGQSFAESASSGPAVGLG